jgi:hypothetical protein
MLVSSDQETQPMTPTTQPPRLFTLRLWQAAAPDDPAALEWRGKLQSLPDGEAYYFRNWPVMIRYLELMLGVEPAASTASANHSE